VAIDVDRLRARAAILHAARTWLHEAGFLELQPPVLVPSPALEANLEAVAVGDAWLHTSPEFALKRALAAGLGRIYAITPCFREEEQGRHHSREFTLLELYAPGWRHLDLMPAVESLVGACARAVGQPAPRFAVRTVSELFGGTIPASDDAFYLEWVDRVEPRLTEPTFVIDWPARQAALAEVRGEVAERVEAYLGGLELANGFSELRDPVELRRRFAESAMARAARGRAPHPVDEALLAATARMPRCAGIAIGVDRLVMALTGASDIASVLITR
jgi:lysyl-tRNA synthetase class 2